jgi:hypothetical protein
MTSLVCRIQAIQAKYNAAKEALSAEGFERTNLTKSGSNSPARGISNTCHQSPTESTNTAHYRRARPTELAAWPQSKREAWGVHAAEMEILGTPLPESERRAFEFVSRQNPRDGVRI